MPPISSPLVSVSPLLWLVVVLELVARLRATLRNIKFRVVLDSTSSTRLVRLNTARKLCHHRSVTGPPPTHNRRNAVRTARSGNNGKSPRNLANREVQTQIQTSLFLCYHNTSRMTPFIQSEVVVTDAEDDDSYERPRSVRPIVPRTGQLLIRHLRNTLAQFVRLHPSGNVRPKIGQTCLIMRGKAGVDEGQVGIVSDTTASMVWVTFLSDHQGKQSSKLKRPSSLIMLDSRSIVSQDRDGTRWIRPREPSESCSMI